MTGPAVGDLVHGIWGHRSEAVLPAAAVAERLWMGQDPVSGTFARVGSIALNALLAADVRLGDRVAVFGQGVIGLLATRLAVLAGAEVVAVDSIEPRLDAAHAMGAAHVVRADAPEGAGALVRAWSGGGGVDSAIELSGNDRALHEAVRSVVVDGTVAASGFYQGGAAHLRLGEEFHHNRVRIVASQISGTPVALGPRWDQPRLVRTFMDQVRRGAGRRAVAGHRRRGRCRRREALRAPRSRRPGRSCRPSSGSPPPRRSGEPPGLDTGPRFPEDRGGVAILGAGTIAQSAHLPAYGQHGVGVTGVWSRTPATTATIRDRFPFVGRVYPSAEALLADPEVRFVDLATGPEGRLDWIEAAVDAGKHVLAQKPLTLSAADLDRLPALLARAEAAGVRVAVNHNGRWAPPWRAATLLVRDGRIGDLVGVTHLHDKPLPPLVGTPFDDVPHMLLTDYLLHWVDITRTWLADGGAGQVIVRAGRRLPRARPAGRRAQPMGRDPVDDRGHRRDRGPADRRQRGLVRPRLSVLGARHRRDAAGQRAAGLRPPGDRRRTGHHPRATARGVVRRRLRGCAR